MTAALLCSGFALSALLIASAAVPVVRLVAARLGLVDDPATGDYKTHSRRTPYGGGLAIWIGTLAPVAAGLAWMAARRPDMFHDGVDWVHPWAPYALLPLEPWSPTVSEVSQALGLLVAATGMLALGLADDRRGLAPGLRFAVQLAVAAALVLFVPGFRLPLPGGPLPAAAFTVLWIVALANAYNFIDNMNGLAAGSAVIGLGACAAVAMSLGQMALALLCLAATGAAAGFLRHNFPAATIFMGDAGGLFLGFVAGAVSAALSAAAADAAPAAIAWRLLPLMVFGLPVYDLVTVVFLRLRRGVAPWVGDTRHVSHRLVAAGLTRTGAVLWLFAAHAGIALPCAAAGPQAAAPALALGTGVLVLLVGTELAVARRRGS